MLEHDMLRRAFLLAAAVLICACEPPQPEAAEGPIELPAEGRAALEAAARERTLFEELEALRLREQGGAGGAGANGKLLERWRAFLAASRGTSYESIANERVEAAEAEARRGLPALRSQLRTGYIDSDWGRVDKHLRPFLVRYRGTAAAEVAREWGRRIDEVRKRSVAEPLMSLGGSSQSWSRAVASGQAKLTSLLRKGNSVHLNQPGASRVDIRFDVARLPEHAELRIRHVATYAQGNEYATVDVAINGRTVCMDWCVASKWTVMNWERSRWPVGDLLRVGENVLTVRLGRSALAVYWLLDLEIRTGSRPAFETLLD